MVLGIGHLLAGSASEHHFPPGIGRERRETAVTYRMAENAGIDREDRRWSASGSEEFTDSLAHAVYLVIRNTRPTR